MKNLLVKLRGKKGVAIIIVFSIALVLLILVSGLASRSISQSRLAARFRMGVQAFDLAEAGLNRSIAWLRTNPAPPVGNFVDPWGGVQNLGAGSYTVTINDLGQVGANASIRRYQVIATGTAAGINRQLSSFVQVDNFARYIWFTEREMFNGTNIWFWSQDTLNGTVHTNAHFNIYGNPVFIGRARSADDYIRFFNNGNNINLSQPTNPPFDNPDFQQGMVFGVDPAVMPNQATALRNAADNGGLTLQGASRVVLLADGTMNVTNTNRNWNNKNMPLPANGALFVKNGNLTISGALNGRLTVGSSQDIIIPGNLVYADDPVANPASNDTLGIIAESDVIISDSAPTNLAIQACVMALNESFMMENWWVGPPKGTLSIHGGIIQVERGPVGTFNSRTGQKVSGYSKNYTFDNRLVNSPPPFMPTTGDFIVLSWEEL